MILEKAFLSVKYVTSKVTLLMLVATYMMTHLPSSKSFGNGQMFGPKTSYMATFQPFSSYQSSFEDYYDIHNSNHYSLVIYLLEPFIDVVPEAHVVDFEGPTDESWYLDSGATHHLTNNMANMNV